MTKKGDARKNEYNEEIVLEFKDDENINLYDKKDSRTMY